MRMTTMVRALALAAAVHLASLAAPCAGKLTHSFRFFQEEYSEDAMVTGFFAGVDLDNNGILVHFPVDGGGGLPTENQELISFSMHFSGNSLVPAFDLGLDDLFGLVHEIDSGDLGDDPAFDPNIGANLIEGIGVTGEEYSYASGNGPTGSIGGEVRSAIDFGEFDASQQIVYVKRVPVPEPAAIGLMAATCAVLAGCRMAARWK